jgi:excinuclease UvrABC nuclease subunit
MIPMQKYNPKRAKKVKFSMWISKRNPKLIIMMKKDKQSPFFELKDVHNFDRMRLLMKNRSWRLKRRENRDVNSWKSLVSV